MRRLAAAALLPLALGAGSASADTFAVVPDSTSSPSRTARSRCRAPRPRTRPARSCSRPGLGGPVPARPRALLRGTPGALAARRRRLRDPVAGARRDQQDRVELRPQHGPELGRRGRLDAVHAGHLAALGHRRGRRRDRRPVESRRRRLRRRALSRRRGRATTSPARSSPTTTPSGTWTRCSDWPRCSAATSPRRLHARQAGAPLEEAQDGGLAQRAARGCRGGRGGSAAASRARLPTARRGPGSCSPTGSLRRRTRSRSARTHRGHRRGGSAPGELAQAQTALETGPQRRRTPPRSLPPQRASCGGRPERTATSSRSAAAPASSGRPHPSRLSRRGHRGPAGRAVYALADWIVLSRVDDGRCGTGFVLQTWTGSSGSTATSRNATRRACRSRCSSPASGSASSAPPATPPARTSIWPQARDELPAGHAVVPGVRRDRLHVAGRGRRRGSRSTPVFALVPPEEPEEDVIEFTLSRG